MRFHVGRSASIAATIATVAWPTAAAAMTAEQAKVISERAAAYIKEVGAEKAFQDFTHREAGFRDGDVYVFCYDQSGVSKADGGNPAFVGRTLLRIKDPDGQEPVALIVKKGFEEGRGWVDYKWPNPDSKRIERKSAYVIRTDDVVCGVGYYRE